MGVGDPFFLKALAQQPIPKHHFRMFGSAANEPPYDQIFGVRSIGWWGMTETVSQGIVGDALLRNRSMTTGRPAPGYGIRILHRIARRLRPARRVTSSAGAGAASRCSSSISTTRRRPQKALRPTVGS